jgi:hypothetical protein
MIKIKTLYILTTFFLLGSYGYAKESELEYYTEQIRETWQACSYKIQEEFPQITKRIRWHLCDCYMDHLRKTYSSLKVKTFSDNESMAIGLEVAGVCPIPEDLLNKSKLIPEKLLSKSKILSI